MVLALSAAFALIPAALEGADANGDTRAISILNVHTNESATVTFKRSGVYDAEGIKQLSWLLRDWRRDEPTSMSPRLFDILWEVHQETGSQEPFHAVSGYRSPATNAMLRRSSRAVAEHSQHMLGKAMDSFLPDVPVSTMREIAMRLQRGGVGYYPTSGSPFVHIDAGSVRAWPRMTRDQLARLFPDGRTVHIPADGHPFAGYDLAKAQILAAGGTVAGYSAYADAEPQLGGGHHKSLWAALFGGADEDEDAAMASGGRSSLSRSAAARQPTQVASLLPMNGDDNGAHALIMAQNQTSASAQPVAASPSPQLRGATLRSTTPAEPAKPAPVAVASAAPSPGVPSFLSALHGDTAPTATGAADTGTTVAVRSNAQAQTGTTIATRSPAATDEDGGKPAAASIIAAYAPLPPRRPKTLADIASLVDIPLPPVRPTNLDAAEPRLATSAPADAPRSDEAGTLVSIDHPLPPARPQAFALASQPLGAAADELTTGSIAAPAAGLDVPQKPAEAASDAGSAGAQPSSSGEVVRLDHPLPPARPVQFALAASHVEAIGTDQPTAAASPQPARRDPARDGLASLFDTSALVPVHRLSPAPIKVANAVVHATLPRVAQDVIARPASAAGHFSASSPQPIVNHFSGKAVEPLHSLGFAATE
ncbi:MAG: DUF882 domain-containing protein [Hyphomicrobiales bacterium]